MKEFYDTCFDEEGFLKQRSKFKWLGEGDKNTSFFHNILKCNINRQRVDAVLDDEGRWIRGIGLIDKFVGHFREFLGMDNNSMQVIPNMDTLFEKKLDNNLATDMIRVITDKEIREAMFDIDDLKAPGTDGYSSKFYKAAWSIVGNDVCRAVREFFWSGKLLKEVNSTRIILVPKVDAPKEVTDYRPIACCSPRCAMKFDIQKAYDTVDWKFLEWALIGFGFHPFMINWIMTCVSSQKFTICINGFDHGFFEGKRGLRQGDPLSPYLFTIVMEVFSLILRRKICENRNFKYHWRCQSQKITHLSFADDLLIFCHGNASSVRVVKEALDEFKLVSGLSISIPKS
ncbi:unnamed protein product [Lactuca virosa]|uniref:Reverse transcriptase domain-containing protein n=1 Tax=Lactuca virosa TaxID=75947 RepID=A0AAU9M1L0_9ASTR|nr:unnamed protein product [Lactuca virosa]